MSVRALQRVANRVVVVALLTTAAGTAAVTVAATPALASTYSMEQQFIADLNAARQANGQAAYAVSSDLTSVARSHSARMASQQSLYHNPSLTTDVSNWQAVGENVGEGPTVADIHQAFMESTEHRDNILDHDFTQVGVGVSVDANGIVWVTEDFREPMSQSTSSSSAPVTQQATTQAAPVSAPVQTSTAAPAASTPSVQPAAATAAPAAAPQVTVSPREMLIQRLHQMRHDRPAVRPVDPVAQAFDYVANLSHLTA